MATPAGMAEARLEAARSLECDLAMQSQNLRRSFPDLATEKENIYVPQKYRRL